MAFFFGATLVWLIRFARTKRGLPDRIAIAVYLFSFLGCRNNPHFSIAQGEIGLTDLFLAWWVSRRSKRIPQNRSLADSNQITKQG